MIQDFWLSLAWILAAATLGFAISAVFSGWLNLSRRIFLIPYAILSSAFLYLFGVWSQIDIPRLIVDNWSAGLVAGLLVGAFLVMNVRSQPSSRQSQGAELVFDLTWLGLVYGLIDALFLNLMPVLAVWQGIAAFAWTTSPAGRIFVAFLALAASLLVTLTYHLGYIEFRNRKVGLVLVGNSLITLAFLLSGNPLGALISHSIMHLAAVLRGPETTLQLPPHLASQQ